MQTIHLVTDTSTICIFDLEAIRHRVNDAPDWWSISSEELDEMNRGNVAFLGVGRDGDFEVTVEDSLRESDVSVLLRCPSGKVFIGAGEEVTAGGLEPECVRGGAFISLKPASYRLDICKVSSYQLSISFTPVNVDSINRFSSTLRL
jgi:hypothetical protein